MSQRMLLAFASLLAGSPALAANGPNLGVSISPPTGVYVEQSARYNLSVTNTGNRSASNVVLTIVLPKTATSPTVYVMGTLGAKSTFCSLDAQKNLVCSLGSVPRNASRPVFFDIALPYATKPLDFTATVTSSPVDLNPNNNTATHTASLRTYSVTMNPPNSATNRHCTGGGTLSSFFECELFPSSLSSHEATLNPDGSISIPEAPGYSGSWQLLTDPGYSAPNRLQFEYRDENGTPVANFDGRGTTTSCFEGKTTFPDPNYISLYEVCLHAPLP